MSIFNLDNSNGKIPNIQKTLDGLSKLLTTRTRIVSTQMTMLSVPLILVSHYETNDVIYDGHYFKDKQPKFIDAFMKADPGKKKYNVCDYSK